MKAQDRRIRINILRKIYAKNYVIAKADFCGEVFYFIENPDYLIPEGIYTCYVDKPGPKGRENNTHADGLLIWVENDFDPGIQIHVANFARELLGCCGIGNSIIKDPEVQGALGVGNSRPSLRKLLTFLPRLPEKFEIKITSARG